MVRDVLKVEPGDIAPLFRVEKVGNGLGKSRKISHVVYVPCVSSKERRMERGHWARSFPLEEWC